MKTLFAWLGNTDIRAADGNNDIGLGPIGQAVKFEDFDQLIILSDHSKANSDKYIDWLSQQVSTVIKVVSAKLTRPTEFGEIYEAAVKAVNDVTENSNIESDTTFHLSPGTPAMASVWIILSKTRFPARLIESSKEEGVRIVSLPFDISAEYLPDLLKKPDNDLIKLSEGIPPDAPEFDSIIHRCLPMKHLIAKARRVAIRDIPVLIQGESGTGKELLARAIHMSSPRSDQAFLPVNCGAIPDNLADAEFFGYIKGAFTGAESSREGYFEAANSGTLFLDEIGELPKHMQVKLLRALQENVIYRIGSRKPQKIDIRIIAATNRNLIEEVANERFREDLFHRLAVGILNIPSIQDRKGDLSLLIDSIMKKLNIELQSQPNYQTRTLSPTAKKQLLHYNWPGNVRELNNTLLRAIIWSTDSRISKQDIDDAILQIPIKKSNVLGRPLGDGFDIQETISEVVRHYFSRALNEAHGVKKKAAELVGLPNYQTFTNWMNKYSS